MKLRDRVVVGFCVSLALVTVLIVVDLQNENDRRLAAVDNVLVFDDGGEEPVADVHGRSDRKQMAFDAQAAWKKATNMIMTTLAPNRWSRIVPTVSPPTTPTPPTPSRPGAPQPMMYPVEHQLYVEDPFVDDRFDDLVNRLSRLGVQQHRGIVTDWSVMRDVIVDDTNEDGTIGNEYIAEYLEEGLK